MNEIDAIEFELDMIRCVLLLNPENKKLSPNEFDQLVVEEYNLSKD